LLEKHYRFAIKINYYTMLYISPRYHRLNVEYLLVINAYKKILSPNP